MDTVKDRPVMRLVLASTLLICSGLTAPAWAVECPSGLGIYRTTVPSDHELLFTSSDGGTLVLSKGKIKATFPFSLVSSNGFSRTYLNISGKDAPSSVVMNFEPDFKLSSSQASSFLVIPDLTSSFYYWDDFRSKYGSDLLPGSTWRLVGCASGNMMGPGRKP